MRLIMRWMGLAFTGCILVAGLAAAEDLSCTPLPPLTELGATKGTQLDSLTRKAMACVRSGKMDMAIDIFNRMIRIDPDNEAAYMNRANTYIRSGRVDQGLADLSFLINARPNFTEAWFNRGVGHLAAKEYVQAIADFDETLRLKPDFAKAYCNRGLARLRNGSVAEALEDLNAGIERSSSLEICFFARGDARFQSGDSQEAVEDYTSGLALKHNLGVLTRRALAYERLGDREKALADFRAVLARAPSNQVARAGLVRLGQVDTE